jgi:hypothetical protein
MRILAAALLLFATVASAEPLRRGDVLVSQDEILWRVDPETGDVEQFSPPLDSVEPNLIDINGSYSIVVDPSGSVFLTSGGIVVEIDPATGEQRELRRRERICIAEICGFVESQLDLGAGAGSIALGGRSSFLVPRRLYVGADDAIYRIDRNFIGELDSTLLDTTGLNEPFQIEYTEIPSPDGFLLYLAFATSVQVWNSFDETIAPAFDESPYFLAGIEAANGDLYSTRGGGASDPGRANVSVGTAVPTPIATGGFLRNPLGLALDPNDETRLFVAENGADSTGRKLLRLDYDGVDWVQTKLADMPSSGILRGVAVSPIDFAPEPASLAASLAAIATLARLRRRRSCAHASRIRFRRSERSERAGEAPEAPSSYR